jgi:hypothetical protein
VARIDISPALGDDLSIRRRSPREPFAISLGGRRYEASTTALLALFQAVNEGEVAEFISDSATHLESYGLDSPFLVVRFIGFDQSELRLDFGSPSDSNEVFGIRKGSTTVVRMKPEVLELIPDQAWDWRPPLVWQISSVDVRSIVRQEADGEKLVLEILNPVTESWRASRGGADVTDQLIKERAEVLLRNLLDLKARNWLSPNHPSVQDRLARPDLTFTLFVTAHDARGETAGVIRRELRIAVVDRGSVKLCYGQVTGDPNPFLLDPQTVELLRVGLVEPD